MAYEKREVKAGDIMDPAWGNHVQKQYEEALPKPTSDSNGECWRFDNGLQICIAPNLEKSVAANTTDYVTWTFPQPFLNGSSYGISFNSGLSAGPSNRGKTTYGDAYAGSVNLYVSNEASTVYPFRPRPIAIGRWK